MVLQALRFQMRSALWGLPLSYHQWDFNDKCFVLPAWKFSWISQSSSSLYSLPFSWVSHCFPILVFSYFIIWIFPLQYALKSSFLFILYTFICTVYFYILYSCLFFLFSRMLIISYKCNFFFCLSKHINDVFLSHIFLSLHWLFPAHSWFLCLFGTSSSCLRLSSDI